MSTRCITCGMDVDKKCPSRVVDVERPREVCLMAQLNLSVKDKTEVGWIFSELIQYRVIWLKACIRYFYLPPFCRYQSVLILSSWIICGLQFSLCKIKCIQASLNLVSSTIIKSNKLCVASMTKMVLVLTSWQFSHLNLWVRSYETSRWWQTLREKAYLTHSISFVSLYLPACPVYICIYCLTYGKMIAVFQRLPAKPTQLLWT